MLLSCCSFFVAAFLDKASFEAAFLEEHCSRQPSSRQPSSRHPHSKHPSWRKPHWNQHSSRKPLWKQPSSCLVGGRQPRRRLAPGYQVRFGMLLLRGRLLDDRMVNSQLACLVEGSPLEDSPKRVTKTAAEGRLTGKRKIAAILLFFFFCRSFTIRRVFQLGAFYRPPYKFYRPS